METGSPVGRGGRRTKSDCPHRSSAAARRSDGTAA
jgi:hypothetical protein